MDVLTTLDISKKLRDQGIRLTPQRLAIAEVVIPFIGRLVGWVFVEFLGHMVCYLTGYAVLKALTLGRHPKSYTSPWSEANKNFYVMLTGGVAWFGLFCLWAWL